MTIPSGLIHHLADIGDLGTKLTIAAMTVYDEDDQASLADFPLYAGQIADQILIDVDRLSEHLEKLFADPPTPRRDTGP